MNNFDLTHFGSSTQKESNFLANFIARQDVLQFFLAQLRTTKDQQAAKHHLIVAPRGYANRLSLQANLKEYAWLAELMWYERGQPLAEINARLADHIVSINGKLELPWKFVLKRLSAQQL